MMKKVWMLLGLSPLICYAAPPVHRNVEGSFHPRNRTMRIIVEENWHDDGWQEQVQLLPQQEVCDVEEEEDQPEDSVQGAVAQEEQVFLFEDFDDDDSQEDEDGDSFIGEAEELPKQQSEPDTPISMEKKVQKEVVVSPTEKMSAVAPDSKKQLSRKERAQTAREKRAVASGKKKKEKNTPLSNQSLEGETRESFVAQEEVFPERESQKNPNRPRVTHRDPSLSLESREVADEGMDEYPSNSSKEKKKKGGTKSHHAGKRPLNLSP